MDIDINSEEQKRDFLRRLKMAKRTETRGIRYIGTRIGGAILLYIIIENVLSIVLAKIGLIGAYMGNSYFQFLVDSFFVIVSMLVPFKLAEKSIGKRFDKKEFVQYGFPQNKGLLMLCIPAGLGACMVGNMVTGYVSTAFSLFGHELSMPDINYPQGIHGFILSAIRIAVMAALCEEISFRGVTMQPLRQYGNKFAVLMSAFVFAILHGNLIQAPFAFIAGIAFGYICIITESIWPTIIIHFLNNFIAMAVSYYIGPDDAEMNPATAIYGVLMYGFIIVGSLCAAILIKRYKGYIAKTNKPTFTKLGKKTLAFIINPTMILAVAYVVWVTIKYIG